MPRIRIRSKLSRLRPVPVKRAIAQTMPDELPAYDLTDVQHTVPWFPIVCGLIGVLVLIELGFAVAVTL